MKGFILITFSLFFSVVSQGVPVGISLERKDVEFVQKVLFRSDICLDDFRLLGMAESTIPVGGGWRIEKIVIFGNYNGKGVVIVTPYDEFPMPHYYITGPELNSVDHQFLEGSDTSDIFTLFYGHGPTESQSEVELKMGEGSYGPESLRSPKPLSQEFRLTILAPEKIMLKAEHPCARALSAVPVQESGE